MLSIIQLKGAVVKSIDIFLITGIIVFYLYPFGLIPLFVIASIILLILSSANRLTYICWSLALILSFLISTLFDPHIDLYNIPSDEIEVKIKWKRNIGSASKAKSIFVILEGPYKGKKFISKRRGGKEGSIEVAHMKIEAFDRPAFNNQFNEEKYLESKGFSAKATLSKRKNIYKKTKTGFKDNVLNRMETSFDNLPGQAGIFLKRILLGSSFVEDFYLKDSMKHLGLSHLLAASGLHVNMLFMWTLFVLCLFPINRLEADIVSLTILLIYAYILDFPASICRAVFFLFFKEISCICKGKISIKRTYLTSLFLYLLFQPYAAYDFGLILSYSSSLAIAISEKIAKRKPLKHEVLKSLRTSLFINLINIPILFGIGGVFALVSFLGNILAIPFFSKLFALGLIAYIFQGLPIIGSLIFNIYSIFYLLFTAMLESMKWLDLPQFDLSGLEHIKGNYIIALFLSITLIFKKFYIFNINASKSSSLGFGFKNKFLYKTYVKAFVFSILMGIFMVSDIAFSKDNFICLDIGQGDSLLMKSKNANILFDTGGRVFQNEEKKKDADMIVSNLKSYGVNSLDAIFISHPDFDHMGNLREILDKIKVFSIFTSPNADGSFPKEIEKMVLNSRVSKAASLICMQDNKRYIFSNPMPLEKIPLFNREELKILVVRKGQYDAINKNDGSAVVLLDYGPKILLTGDYEHDIVKNIKIDQLDLLKCAHHGSKNGTSLNMLKSWKPKSGIISAGRNNRYGHPHNEVIMRLDSLKIPYRSTAYEGDIIYEYVCGRLKSYSKKEAVYNKTAKFIFFTTFNIVIIRLIFKEKKLIDGV